MSTKDHPDWWRPVGGSNAQDSTLERRSLIWNDNDVEAPDAPPESYTNEEYKGKFFTRGCRGMIEQIQLYCRHTAAGGIILHYSPHPGLGPFGAALFAPGANWAWVNANIQEMWDYDSLFIWVAECPANQIWGYDTEQPYDGHESGDAGATWADMAIRPFIRVVYTGETPGDIPVSGIINNIEIPNSAGERATATVAVPNNVFTEVCHFNGAGTMLQAMLDFDTAVVPAAGVSYELWVACDGADEMIWGNRQITQSLVATTGRCSCGEFIQYEGHTYIYIRVPVKFKRIITLYALQTSGAAVDTLGRIYANALS